MKLRAKLNSAHRKNSRTVILLTVLVLVLGACSTISAKQIVSPTPFDRKPTATATLPATATLTATATATATSTATLTLASPISEATVAPTQTPTMTPTAVPMPTPDGITREIDVPILMYHYICTPPADADDVRIDLSTSPETFRNQLAALDAAGYTTISLYDLVFALQTGQALPDNPIILTFDDGYRDNYENAFPILQDYGMTATFFVITGYIDEGRPDYITWDQVSEMAQAGMSIESHSYNHADLSNKDVDYLVWQILGPKQAIEERTGASVRFFCYPGGSYDDLVIQVLKSADYWAAVTVYQDVLQTSDGLFELSRIRVRSSYTGQDLLDVIDDFMTGED